MQRNLHCFFHSEGRLIAGTIRLFDLFSGIGGFREGLHRAGGFTCVGHCEADAYADHNYRVLFDTEESGSAMTQEILKQNECRTLIFYVRDFLARHSQSLDEGKDLPMQEEPFSLKLPDWLQTNDLRIFSLKTYPVCFRMTKGGRFTPSSVRYLNWGIMSNGKCLTARISESPSQGSGCILSDILMEDVPEKYYLSQKQMEQLLYKSMLAKQGERVYAEKKD